MKLISTFILSTALLSGYVIAAPGSLPQEHRRASRLRAGAGIAHSKPPIALDESASTQELVNSDAIQPQYSGNWAGGVYTGNGVTSVSGTVKAPTPSVPKGGSSSTQYCASVWIGIDGNSCNNVILQAGINVCIQGSRVTYGAWYEWYPDHAYDLNGLNIGAGDTIQITATASSTNGGSVSIVNTSKGTHQSHTFSGESVPLCERNAEWIVEDPASGSPEKLVPFANLGTLTFTNATALTSSGMVGAGNTQIFDISQNGKVLTRSGASGNSVTVKHT